MKIKIEIIEACERWIFDKNGAVMAQLTLESWPFSKTKTASFDNPEFTSRFNKIALNKEKIFFLSAFEVSKVCSERDLNSIFTFLIVNLVFSYTKIRFLLFQLGNNIYNGVGHAVDLKKFTTEINLPSTTSHKILMVKNSVRNLIAFYRLIFKMNWKGYTLIDHKRTGKMPKKSLGRTKSQNLPNRKNP